MVNVCVCVCEEGRVDLCFGGAEIRLRTERSVWAEGCAACLSWPLRRGLGGAVE